jgi:cyclic lactone autoinducer peptide
MRRIMICLAMVVAASAAATAAPIVYQQPEMPPGAQNVPGVNTQTSGNAGNPVGATYHYFYATAGTQITLNGDRLRGPYDMSFWVFSGLFNDTNQFGGSFDAGDPGFIDFGDDEDPANIPGPFGDPRTVFNAPTTGFYTIAVTNFASGDNLTQNPYNLDILGNVASPEPLSIAVFGGLLAVGGLAARRRMTKVIA